MSVVALEDLETMTTLTAKPARPKGADDQPQEIEVSESRLSRHPPPRWPLVERLLGYAHTSNADTPAAIQRYL